MCANRHNNYLMHYSKCLSTLSSNKKKKIMASSTPPIQINNESTKDFNQVTIEISSSQKSSNFHLNVISNNSKLNVSKSSSRPLSPPRHNVSRLPSRPSSP